jgi:glycosyltransferase involved in cell wall biosynthesis
MLKRKNRGKFFFFLDRYVIGGAQRVHLDMLESIKDEYKHLYFTRLSPNSGMKDDFFSQPNTEPKDIHFFCDNLLLRLFTVHFYAFYVNRHKGAYVFSSNSTFFYDMLPFLGKQVTKTELLHNFTYGNNGMEFFGLANYRMLDQRMVIDAATRENIINQYKEYHIPSEYSERITLIEPGVPIPPMPQKNYELPLKILYAGRGTPQKRIYLLNQIAEHCINNQLPVEFHFAGTMMDELSDLVKSHSVIHGEISGQTAMYNLYKQCHTIMMTSAYEGFPMLIKESMACGCIPIVTALEGNKTHMKHGENSLLMFHPEDEAGVVRQGIAYIQYLANDKQNIAALCEKAYLYAQEHFDKNVFISRSRKFLLEE